MFYTKKICEKKHWPTKKKVDDLKILLFCQPSPTISSFRSLTDLLSSTLWPQFDGWQVVEIPHYLQGFI